MKPPNMPVPVLQGDAFVWKDGVGVTEASNFGKREWCARLYDDACDVGCKVRSHRTGSEVVFYLVKGETRDGETISWHLKSLDGRIRLVVFND